MRILMPSIVDPAEARGGCWTVTRGLIKAIHIALPQAEIECLAFPARGRAEHVARQVISVAQSVLGGSVPAKVAFTRSSRLRNRLRHALGESKPDLVIINGSDLFWMLSELPDGVPVVAVAQNIEQELYARQIAGSPFERILESDLRKLREYEWSGMKRVGRVIFLTEEDRALAIRVCAAIDSVVIPPVFDYEPAARNDSAAAPLRIGMFADFTWWPNRVSLDWFLRDVWSSVSRDLQLHLIGHGSDRAGKGVRGVSSHGSIRDPRDAFAMCDLMIAPIIEGAGVKVKVAEALYNRVPIVATSFATRGLPAVATASVKKFDSAAEWVRFLDGDGPEDVARRPVNPEAAASFSMHAAGGLLKRFLVEPGSRLIA